MKIFLEHLGEVFLLICPTSDSWSQKAGKGTGEDRRKKVSCWPLTKQRMLRARNLERAYSVKSVTRWVPAAYLVLFPPSFLGLVFWTTELNTEDTASREKPGWVPVRKNWKVMWRQILPWSWMCLKSVLWLLSAGKKIILPRWRWLFNHLRVSGEPLKDLMKGKRGSHGYLCGFRKVWREIIHVLTYLVWESWTWSSNADWPGIAI